MSLTSIHNPKPANPCIAQCDIIPKVRRKSVRIPTMLLAMRPEFALLEAREAAVPDGTPQLAVLPVAVDQRWVANALEMDHTRDGFVGAVSMGHHLLVRGKMKPAGGAFGPVVGG